MAAIVFALGIRRHHLYEEKYELFTNYRSLKYAFTQKEQVLEKQRWLKLARDYG